MTVRQRLYPTPSQVAGLEVHCAHSRFVWNLALEQWSMWRPGKGGPPRQAEQCRQLTEARAEFDWLGAGSVIVQQQALRDFRQAVENFFRGSHGRPTWRKAGQHEGFRIVQVQPHRLEVATRRWGRVLVPKVGWVRFRMTRPLPSESKSYRVTRDRAGRWHIAFMATPSPIAGPGTGEVGGVDRGVRITATLSTGEMLHCPKPSARELARVVALQRQIQRCTPGSNRRRRAIAAMARIRAREVDRRKDWVEKTTTRLAREFDVIRVEDLQIANMTRSARGTLEAPGTAIRAKAGLNRAILSSGWGLFLERLQDKAAGRVERVPAFNTSQTCSRCGTVDPKARESQAVFRCRTCHHILNADVNAAINIAAGPAVTGRVSLAASRRERRQPLGRSSHPRNSRKPGVEAKTDWRSHQVDARTTTAPLTGGPKK